MEERPSVYILEYELNWRKIILKLKLEIKQDNFDQILKIFHSNYWIKENELYYGISATREWEGNCVHNRRQQQQR